MSHPETIEPPDGFQPTGREPGDHRDLGHQPDWLVGAEEGLGQLEARGPLRVVPGGESGRPGPPAPAPETPPGKPIPWAAAASSVPRLTVVPRREKPAQMRALPDDDLPTPAGLEEVDGEDLQGTSAVEAGETIVPIKPHHEPWWLVLGEELATNRRLQIGILAVVAASATVMFWPRGQEPGVSLGHIKKHPTRFEGRAVRVRGEVGEVFEIGQGYVFHLLQGRDSVVIFSPTRNPSPHDRVTVVGTVSTGYLDGLPRVAIFETPGADRKKR